MKSTDKKGFTHELKSSGQKCFKVFNWPSQDKDISAREMKWPLYYLEGGQITRVRNDNLKKLK